MLELFSDRFLNTRLAKKDPINAKNILELLHKKREKGTKLSYMSAFKQFVCYCNTIREEPLLLPLDSELVTFFIADRISSTGSAGSLTNWTGMLNWLHELARVNNNYQNSKIYKTYMKAVRKQYKKPADSRLPFKIEHIYNYTRFKGVNIVNAINQPLNILTEVLAAQIGLFTMLRPCEFSNSKYSYSKNGIKLKYAKQVNDRKNPSHLYILIKDHKTKQYKPDPKFTYLTDTRCNMVKNGLSKKCLCYYLNPYRILDAYMQIRQNNILLPNKARYGKQFPNNKLLVWDNGSDFSTTDLTKITKDIVKINHITKRDKNRYSNYSYRIGGATISMAMGINHVKLLKFVGWTDSFLSDSSISYMRPDTDSLLTIPYEMIHGLHNNNTQKLIEFYNQGLVFDPWTKQTKSRKR